MVSHLLQDLKCLIVVVSWGLYVSSASAEGLEVNGAFSIIGAVERTEPASTALNPDNQVLNLPKNKAVTEMRLRLKLSDNKIQLIFRPRLRLIYTDPAGRDETSLDSTISEAFLHWQVTPQIIFAYGRQNYQWGPAEAASPSNRIFPETAGDRGILYLAQGKDLARLNFSIGQNFSTIFMAEYAANTDEPVFMSEKKFHATGLVKPEINWGGGVNYFGLVAGGRANFRPWSGAYFNVKAPFFDGLAFYGDLMSERGSYGWYPVTKVEPSPDGADVTLTEMGIGKAHDNEVYNFYVGGLRLDFMNGDMARIEYIRYDAGYSADERELLHQGWKSPDPNQQLKNQQNSLRYLNNGLAFPGREFLFFSLYSPDFLTIIDLNFYSRILNSLNDNSIAYYASLDYLIGRSGTLSGSTMTVTNAKDSELAQVVSSSYVLAYKMDF